MAAFVVIGACGCVFLYFIMNPVNDRFKSGKNLVAMANSIAGKADVAVYGDIPQTLTFYRPGNYYFITDAGELHKYLVDGKPGPKYCVMLEKTWAALAGSDDDMAEAVGVYEDEQDGVVLLKSGEP